MKIDISEILNRETTHIDINFEGNVEGLENPINGYFLPENVSFRGALIRVKNLLNLSGKINFQFDTNCYRCLQNIHGDMTIDVNENVYNAATVKPGDDVFTYEGNYLDLDVILKNYIILNLPMKEVCSPECKGLCPKCGKNLNKGKCDCDDDMYINPQMEVLKQLNLNDNE